MNCWDCGCPPDVHSLPDDGCINHPECKGKPRPQPRPSRQYTDASPIEAKLRSLATLQENWDSYGAGPIDKRAIFAAFRLLAALSRDPAVVPTVEGGVQLEWHRNGFKVELEIGPDGKLVE